MTPMSRRDGSEPDSLRASSAVVVRRPIWRAMRPMIAVIPALALLGVAFLIDAQQRAQDRLSVLAAHARHAAEAVDLHLGKLLELTAFCASSPALVARLDLDTVAENCGRYADLLGGWVVLIELGETHRHILNTRLGAQTTLHAYPREEERPPLQVLELQSRASGEARIADVFEGRVLRTGVVTAGQHLRLGDGRPAMLYVSLDVEHLSRLIATFVGSHDGVAALVDASHRIVARSVDIDRYLFADAPVWLSELRRTGQAGSLINQPGPTAIGGRWDVGFHPLSTAPGWMAVALEPRSPSVWPPNLTALPLTVALLGMVLSASAFWVIGHRDLTATRLAAAEESRLEAERSNREKSRLLASLAHDIRSPVISLLGSLEHAVESAAIDAPEIRRAQRSAEALLELVDNILEVSSLGSSTLILTPSPVALGPYVEDLILQHEGDAASKGLRLALERPEAPLPVVAVDRLRLAQVLGNLLSNAIKYTDTGTVTLRLAAIKDAEDRVAVTFTVSDTGIGIAVEDIPTIFREFGRLESAVASGKPGTGLGLAICQRILQGMDSKLSLVSTPGIGSVFTFTLVLPVLSGEASVIELFPLAGTTILFAEDEPVIRDVTARRLTAAGARVVEAQDGAEALAMLDAVSPDLILLDIQMPGLDGIEVLRRLRETVPPISCPVFVLTSHIAGSQAAEARMAGADEIFTKPVQILPLATSLCAHRASRCPERLMKEPVPFMTSEPLLNESDFGVVAKAAGADMERVFIPRFAETLHTDLVALATAVAAEQATAACEIAHRSRGLCQVMGARRLALALLNFEKSLPMFDASAAQGSIHGLTETLEATLAAMQRGTNDPSGNEREQSGQGFEHGD